MDTTKIDVTGAEGATRSATKAGVTQADLGRTYQAKLNGDVVGRVMVTGEDEALLFPTRNAAVQFAREQLAKRAAAELQPVVELQQLFPHWEDQEVDVATAVYRLRTAHADLEN